MKKIAIFLALMDLCAQTMAMDADTNKHAKKATIEYYNYIMNNKKAAVFNLHGWAFLPCNKNAELILIDVEKISSTKEGILKICDALGKESNSTFGCLKIIGFHKNQSTPDLHAQNSMDAAIKQALNLESFQFMGLDRLNDVSYDQACNFRKTIHWTDGGMDGYRITFTVEPVSEEASFHAVEPEPLTVVPVSEAACSDLGETNRPTDTIKDRKNSHESDYSDNSNSTQANSFSSIKGQITQDHSFESDKYDDSGEAITE